MATTFIRPNPPVIGHRGACAYAPENTMASFIKAAQLNLQWVEFDVMLSSDDIPIIFHDTTLNRTTNGRGKVNHYPYAYLQTLDAGKWFDYTFSGERIPTLLTVIQFLQEAKMSANIEIKTLPESEEKLIQHVMRELQPYLAKNNNQFLFSSFSFSALHLLRKIAPHCHIGMLLDTWEPNWKNISLALDCVAVNVNHNILTEKIAQEIKALGKILCCYTVNDPTRAHELYTWGVDAVFSDAPDIMKN